MTYSLPQRPIGEPTATVVIPCYRYGHYLPEAVKAALSQKFVKTNVIIVDDHSTDNSASIARKLADTDSRIRTILHAENKGHIQTYNDGLAAVDTDFFALVSADDLLAAGALDRAIALMQKCPEVGLVYGKVVTFSGQAPGKVRSIGSGIWRTVNGQKWLRKIAECGFNPIMSPEAVVRTSVMRQIGGFNASLPHSGDFEYWIRIASRWDIGQIRGCVQAYYRIHGANMHTTVFGTTLDNLEQKIAAFRTLDKGGGSASLETQRIFDRAIYTLSNEALTAARRCLYEGRREEAFNLAKLAHDQTRDPNQKSSAHMLLILIEAKEQR